MTGHGNRGMTFESLIEYANRRYRHDGTAIVTKQHTKFIPIRNGTGSVVTCKVEEKATVDYMGRIGDRPLAFEAKHSADDRIALNRVEPHQFDFLLDWTAQPEAIGFVLVSFKFAEFYVIPFHAWMLAANANEAKKQGRPLAAITYAGFRPTGKASIRSDELPGAWGVPSGGAAALDYVTVIKKQWRI